jgi:hypothetical protein
MVKLSMVGGLLVVTPCKLVHGYSSTHLHRVTTQKTTLDVFSLCLPVTEYFGQYVLKL